MDLTNQTAFVTGAASGLGAAVVKHLVNKQVKVAAIDTNADSLAIIAKETDALPITADVISEKDIQSAIKTSQQTLGDIRILVNCAGICPAQRIVTREGSHDLSDFKRVIDINLIGTFNVMRLLAEHILELAPQANDERGVIINTASIAADEGQIGQAAYSASKAGIAGMTLPAAREFGEFGIRVNAIAPGIMRTPMLENMPEKVKKKLTEMTVFPKRLGEPTEFALLVEQLIENTLLNGTVIRLDGVMRMQA